jgi:hypothetical protein
VKVKTVELRIETLVPRATLHETRLDGYSMPHARIFYSYGMIRRFGNYYMLKPFNSNMKPGFSSTTSRE